MTTEFTEIAIKIMGREYQIRCPQTDADSLADAASYLEDKMCGIKDSGKVLSLDRIAVIAALNISHQFLALEKSSHANMQAIQQRLQDLQQKIDAAMELSSAE